MSGRSEVVRVDRQQAIVNRPRVPNKSWLLVDLGRSFNEKEDEYGEARKPPSHEASVTSWNLSGGLLFSFFE